MGRAVARLLGMFEPQRVGQEQPGPLKPSHIQTACRACGALPRRIAGAGGAVVPAPIQAGLLGRSADAVAQPRATPNPMRRSFPSYMPGSVSLCGAAPLCALRGVDPAWQLLGNPGASRG